MSAKLPEIELPQVIALLRIVRPEKRNALNDPTVLGIDFFSNIPEHVRAVIIEAGGENFSAGLDLSEIRERSTIDGVTHSMMWHDAIDKIECGRVPVAASYGEGQYYSPMFAPFRHSCQSRSQNAG
jgi:(methylthio)acryloyl-CoA hydratase